jgi:hypothetical protein
MTTAVEVVPTAQQARDDGQEMPLTWVVVAGRVADRQWRPPLVVARIRPGGPVDPTVMARPRVDEAATARANPDRADGTNPEAVGRDRAIWASAGLG